MIDLSYLTEEEQGLIMTVLRRDAQLKKAEEQRVRKLESIQSEGSSPSDSKLKYLTGEWFYEAKSRRHRDKIHGSEIILASMKQTRAFEGSFRGEGLKAASSRSSDLCAPPKPARYLDVTSQQELSNADEEDFKSAGRSPRTMRHNPFNSESLNVFEPTEDAHIHSQSQEPETEPASSLKYGQPSGSSQTSTSTTSDGSFAGFKPVPKRRTFASKRNTSQSDSSGVALDPQVGSVGIIPAPRQSFYRGSSGSSNQSNRRGQKMESTAMALPLHSDGISKEPPCAVSQVMSHSSLEGDKTPSSLNIDRTFPRNGESLNTETAQTTKINLTQRDQSDHATGSILHPEIGDGVLTGKEEQEWSLPRSIVGGDPPISYDINYTESSEQKVQKRSHQKHAFKLTTQTSSPTGNDEDSIAKVLDWFTRSTDSINWLDDIEGTEVSKSHSGRHYEMDASGTETIKREEGSGGSIQEKQTKMLSVQEQDLGPKDALDGIVKNDTESQTHQKILNKYPNNMTATIPGGKDESGIFSGKVTYARNGEDELKYLSDNQSTKEFDPHVDSLTLEKGSDVQMLHVEHLMPQSQSPLQSSPKPKGLTSVQTYPQVDTSYQSRDPATDEVLPLLIHTQLVDPDSEKLSRAIQPADLKTLGSNVETFTTTQRHPGQDLMARHSKDPSSMSAKTNDQADSPHSQRQNPVQEESTTKKISQLKYFWEQERTKPVVHGGRPKAARGAKLNKRFSKSELDLRAVSNNSGSDGEDCERNHLNPRLEKMSPTLGKSREHFNSLLEFWDDATTDSKYFDKPKSPTKQLNIQRTRQDLQNSEPKSLSPGKTSHHRLINDATNILPGPQVAKPSASKGPKEIVGRQEKATKAPTSPTKEAHSPKSRKDSFSRSSGRGGSMRRATSMFTLIDPEPSSGQLKIDISPVHSHSRKGYQYKRQASEGNETPLARAFVPRDYRHYLGMVDEPSINSTRKEEVSQALGGPARTSTPVGSGERHFKRTTKMSPRHLWTNNSTDADPETSGSRPSESRSNSRKTSNRRNYDDDQNPVRKALLRAEARPKHLAKSMEDLTASSSQRQERQQDPNVDMRRTSNAAIPFPSSTLFSNPENLKKMSKSVPSFLQKEDDNNIYEDVFLQGRDIMDFSDMASVSSLSGSVTTVDSSDFGNVEVQGNIQFSINYVNKLGEFHIFVAECRDLASVNPKRGHSDPYVKSYLMPDKVRLGKRKTSVKKKTLHPTFNEILRYRVNMDYLRTQTLVLSVWHNDTFGRNSFLGEVDVDLSKWNVDHTQMNCLALKARTPPPLPLSSGQGEMRLAIRFLPKAHFTEGVAKDRPTAGEIHIWVKECKKLPLVRTSIDPYVKCFVLPDTSKKSRQKTRVLKRTTEPVFNHTMVYDGIREMDLVEACVELTVWDRDRLASNLLGGLRLGAGTGQSYGSAVDWMDSTPAEVALWERMAAFPSEWAEDVLPLRTLTSTKTALR
uniref:synaptotagmin-like protein 2 n=1 Tax=Doryrhamphus excisus TaxID=161450 RepID=UPI0025AE61ED|nr:synaptotagmin-like protein 2 [Doryrhamphus excisus]XP_057935823.1 synaptotagmin-like protein 2 [Doryrhamphus excisus]XP_057935824.1 synaptotagmin-like protein 2 [Doryrhamphus excisus]XP_057935825.1 synaptotagmin-like protein 2 [Doryrhamphus excisus]